MPLSSSSPAARPDDPPCEPAEPPDAAGPEEADGDQNEVGPDVQGASRGCARADTLALLSPWRRLIGTRSSLEAGDCLAFSQRPAVEAVPLPEAQAR